jgi:hypothetical protein
MLNQLRWPTIEEPSMKMGLVLCSQVQAMMTGTKGMSFISMYKVASLSCFTCPYSDSLGRLSPHSDSLLESTMIMRYWEFECLQPSGKYFSS